MKRRNKAEIAAGMTIEQKQDGVTLEDLQGMQTATQMNERPSINKRKTLRDRGREILKEEEAAKLKSTPKQKIDKTRKLPTVKTVTEIRILNKGEEKSLHELLEDEFADGKWEWKEVPINADFNTKELAALGKQGWKFAFVFERQAYLPETKLPNIVLLHRLKK